MEITSKPLMMIVNPAAGKSINHTAVGQAVDAFCTAGYNPMIYYTSGPGTATELAAQLGGQFDRLVCLGGDGTLSDVIGGLMRLPPEQRPKLGYIPMGTANDVANTLGLPMHRPDKAVEKILNGDALLYDVGEIIGHGTFAYISAFGAFTGVSYETDQDLKKALGHWAYIIEAVSSLPTIKSYHALVEYDNGKLEGDFIYGAVTNAVSVGGVMKMDRDLVDLSDGKFEILLVRQPGSLADFNSIVTGILNHSYNDSPCLQVVQTGSVRFTFDEPVAWTRDGEAGGVHSVIDFYCHKQGVTIYK